MRAVTKTGSNLHHYMGDLISAGGTRGGVGACGGGGGHSGTKWLPPYPPGVTHCHTVVQSNSGEHQNKGAVNSFEGKKGGQSTSN